MSPEERLFSAAYYGELETTKALCSYPALNINWRDDGGFTPLSGACQAGQIGVVRFLLSLKGIDPNTLLNDGATPFFMACAEGHKEVVSLLLADPRIDPNKPQNDGVTPFFIACENVHKEVVSLLLANPVIDPNKPHSDGATPFNIVCQRGHHEVVSLLLADPRVDPNETTNNQNTPLWYASQEGHFVVVQHLLASGREIDTKMKSTFNNKTAAEQGRQQPSVPKSPMETEEDFRRRQTCGPLCADLIDDYERDPKHLGVFHRLRRQPGLREYFIGHLLALIVFHSDSFVAIKNSTVDYEAKRFFRITSQLPFDMQMVLCNRIFGSPKVIILSRDSEPGFRLLARTTTWQQ